MREPNAFPTGDDWTQDRTESERPRIGRPGAEKTRPRPSGAFPDDEPHTDFGAAAWDPAEAGLGDDLDLERYLNGLRRRWPLIVVICLLFGALALVRYSLTPKQYEAKTIIQIERKRLSLFALGQAGWLEDWWNQEYYPTQYRLLKSRGMAERVVLNLRLYEDASFTGRSSGGLFPQGDAGAATRRDDAAELARLASRLQAGLSVYPIEDTQLVELIYRSTAPDLAARVANGYAEAFIQWGIETRNTTVGRASSFLTAQLESLRQEIEERELQLNAYTHDLDIALDPAGEALLERRGTLESQYNGVFGERVAKEAAYRELLSLSDDMIANTASGGRVTALEEEIFQLESEYKTKLETFSPEWPDMVELQSTIEEKREERERLVREQVNQARDQAYAEFQKARSEEDAIAEELRKLADESRQLNSTALEYNNLRTIINTRKELLADLLKRQSQTEVASRVETSQESNVRIVDRAVVPQSPFTPILERDLIQSLFLGFLLAVSGVVLLEYFDRTVKTPDELERLTHLPNLAVIPDVAETGRGFFGYGRRASYDYGDTKKGRQGASGKATGGHKGRGDGAPEVELLPHRNSRLPICEAYRGLRTALLLSSAHTLRSVVVTSAAPGEGKTATTVNLAVVLAQLGRRVLVIDADLRRPRLHKILRISNRTGLVNYLTGQAELDQIFLKSEIPNLWVCPAGPIPPNPSELLSAMPMEDCIQSGAQHFDVVLIDTPPVLPVADAVILGTRVDGVIVCARAGALSRDEARICRERLAYEEIRILGTVLNCYRPPAGGADKRYRYYELYAESPPAGEKKNAA